MSFLTRKFKYRNLEFSVDFEVIGLLACLPVRLPYYPANVI